MAVSSIFSLLLTVAASRGRDFLRQDHCFHMGASVPEKDEGVVYTYGHRPASDFEGIDKKPPPQVRSDRWGRFIYYLIGERQVPTFIPKEL